METKTDPIKKLVYKCPICHEQITFTFNTEAHERNETLRKTGLGHYYDIHYSKIHGMHEIKLSIDMDLSIRGVYPVSQLAKLDDSETLMPSSAGYFLKQDVPTQPWKYWSWISIVSSTHQLIISVGANSSDFYFESTSPPRQQKKDIIWDRVISTGASVTIDWLSEIKDNERLFYWMFHLSDILQGAATITLNEITEALKYIDERAHQVPSQEDLDVLRILLDMDTGIIKVNYLNRNDKSNVMNIIMTTITHYQFQQLTSDEMTRIKTLIQENAEKGFTINDLFSNCKKIPLRNWARIIYDLQKNEILKLYPSYLENVETEYTENEFGILF